MRSVAKQQAFDACADAVAEWWVNRLIRTPSAGQPVRMPIPSALALGFAAVVREAARSALDHSDQPRDELGAFRRRVLSAPWQWDLVWVSDQLVLMLQSAGIEPDVGTLPWMAQTVVRLGADGWPVAIGQGRFGMPVEMFFDGKPA